jgi:hypothetical protein
MAESIVLCMTRLVMLISTTDTASFGGASEVIKLKMNGIANHSGHDSLKRRFTQFLDVLDNPDKYSSLRSQRIPVSLQSEYQCIPV